MGNQYLDFGWETGRKKSPPASSSYQSPSTQNDPWVKMLHSELIHSLHSFASPWSIQQTEGQTTALLRVVSSYIVFSLLPTSLLTPLIQVRGPKVKTGCSFSFVLSTPGGSTFILRTVCTCWFSPERERLVKVSCPHPVTWLQLLPWVLGSSWSLSLSFC